MPDQDPPQSLSIAKQLLQGGVVHLGEGRVRWGEDSERRGPAQDVGVVTKGEGEAGHQPAEAGVSYEGLDQGGQTCGGAPLELVEGCGGVEVEVTTGAGREVGGQDVYYL